MQCPWASVAGNDDVQGRRIHGMGIPLNAAAQSDSSLRGPLRRPLATQSEAAEKRSTIALVSL